MGNVKNSPPLTCMVDSLLLAHGREVLWVDEHSKEMVEWVGLYEDLEAPGIETEGAQRVGQRREHLASDRDLSRNKIVILAENRRAMGQPTCLLMMELSMTQGRPLS